MRTGRCADPASWLQAYVLAETSTLRPGLAVISFTLVTSRRPVSIEAMRGIQTLQQTGHAKEASARRYVNFRVSRLLSWLFADKVGKHGSIDAPQPFR
jgi:hypothetical protein